MTTPIKWTIDFVAAGALLGVLDHFGTPLTPAVIGVAVFGFVIDCSSYWHGVATERRIRSEAQTNRLGEGG